MTIARKKKLLQRKRELLQIKLNHKQRRMRMMTESFKDYIENIKPDDYSRKVAVVYQFVGVYDWFVSPSKAKAYRDFKAWCERYQIRETLVASKKLFGKLTIRHPNITDGRKRIKTKKGKRKQVENWIWLDEPNYA